MTRRPFNPEGYADWRKTVPFTDEQIALQLEADAAVFAKDGNNFMADRYAWRASQVRKGHLSAPDLHRVFSAMIKECAICGKKALYLAGNSGRCSTHRMVKDSYAMRRRARIEQRESDFEQTNKQFDRLRAARERFHAMDRARDKR